MKGIEKHWAMLGLMFPIKFKGSPGDLRAEEMWAEGNIQEKDLF